MKPPSFRLESPDTLDEVLSSLAEHGGDAKIIAGGQSLMPLLAFRLARPELLIDLTGVADLDHLSVDGTTLTVGALTTHRAVEKAAETTVPATIRSAVAHIGHVGIRNRGTVGGSLAHGDPSAEWAAVALAYDGVIVAVSRAGKRRIAADDFFLEPWTTALRQDEVVRELLLQVPLGLCGSAYFEFARRHGDPAVAGVCAVLFADPAGTVVQARLSVIGAGQVAVRCRPAEQALTGRPLDPDVLIEVSQFVVADIEPRGQDEDEHRHQIQVVGTLARRAVRSAADQISKVAQG
ncbi:MAG: FAD binding domain-containing protein [Nakamurella sp.]